MTTRRRSGALALSLAACATLALVTGCAGGPPPDPTPSTPGRYDIGAVVRANALGNLPARAVEAHRGPHCSIHVVQVADQMATHVHEHSDETIVLWRGAGVMIIDGEARDFGAGQVVHIPKGTPHQFRLVSSEPAVGVTVFTPRLKDGDRTPVTK